jgi:hypothetical protein
VFSIYDGLTKIIIMKRLLAAVTIVTIGLFASQTGFAQTNAAGRQAEMKQKLMTDLKMTEVQADSVVSISMSYMPQRREIFQDQSLSPDDKKAKMKGITEQVDKRLQPILGDSLLKQYQDWRMNNMQQMRGNKPPNG